MTPAPGGDVGNLETGDGRSPVVVQVTRLGTTVTGSTAQLQQMRREFACRSCIVLPQLLAPDIVAAVQSRLRNSEFYERTHSGIGVELCLARGPLSGTLEFLANYPALFEVIERITDCGTIGCFQGRVYRMYPGGAHYDSWHSDVGEGRLVAMSINLTPERYRGGTLQIRRAESDDILHEVANVGLGDGLLFRIDPALRHRVSRLEGDVPRTAYAGWFRAWPRYDDLFKATMQRRREGS